MLVSAFVSVPAANADGANPPRLSATTARATRRVCCLNDCMGTPTLSREKSVQDGAETRDRRGAGLQRAAKYPADVAVLVGARLALGAVLRDRELCRGA